MDDIFINIEEDDCLKRFFDKSFISVEEMREKIFELKDELDNLREEYEMYRDYVKDNYMQIPVSQQIGITDEDFM